MTAISPQPAVGRNELREAIDAVKETAAILFAADARVHAVGVAAGPGGKPIYRAVRNVKKIVAQSQILGMAAAMPKTPFPVVFVDAHNDPASLARVPLKRAAAVAAAALLPEQQLHRPLRCGLQIQNFDDDDREGMIRKGFMIVGSIGCFVKKAGNGHETFLLSNNHVVAGENRGVKGDRILQAGGAAFSGDLLVGKLDDFVAIRFSPANARPENEDVIWNDVDAGLAAVDAGIASKNSYLPVRTGVTAPKKVGVAKRNDKVAKVGRTTGLTRGKVTSVATVVGPIEYDKKPAWFHNSVEIEGIGGAFSDHGDSGSGIVNAKGELVALLYAGNGEQTYACPIQSVLSSLSITV